MAGVSPLVFLAAGCLAAWRPHDALPPRQEAQSGCRPRTAATRRARPAAPRGRWLTTVAGTCLAAVLAGWPAMLAGQGLSAGTALHRGQRRAGRLRGPDRRAGTAGPDPEPGSAHRGDRHRGQRPGDPVLEPARLQRRRGHHRLRRLHGHQFPRRVGELGQRRPDHWHQLHGVRPGQRDHVLLHGRRGQRRQPAQCGLGRGLGHPGGPGHHAGRAPRADRDRGRRPGEPVVAGTVLQRRRGDHRLPRLPGHEQEAGGQRHRHRHDREKPDQRDRLLVQGDRGQQGRRGSRLGCGIRHPDGQGHETRTTERADREPRQREGHAVLDGAGVRWGRRHQRLRDLPGNQPWRGIRHAGQREPGRRH